MRSPRVRMTIGQLMAATLVVALALAPIVATLKSPRTELIVATAAFEVILLPVIIALLVMGLMKPGRARDWVIAFLCATPAILFFGVFFAAFVVGNLLQVSLAIVRHDFIAVLNPVVLVLCLLPLIPKRCPSCGKRQLRPLSRPVPGKRMWLPSGLYQCGHCGKSARGNPYSRGLIIVPEEVNSPSQQMPTPGQ